MRADLLTLGAVGALALAGGMRNRRRYGSFAVGPLSALQDRMLRIKNEYAGNPEMAIRVIDTTIAAVTNYTGGKSLPGMHYPEDALWVDSAWIFNENVASGRKDFAERTDGPKINDYLAQISIYIRDNGYTAIFDKAARTQLNLTLTYDGTKWASWFAREVSRVVRAAKQRTNADRKTLAKLLNQIVAESGLSDARVAEQLDMISSDGAYSVASRIQAYRAGTLLPSNINLEKLLEICRAKPDLVKEAKGVGARIERAHQTMSTELQRMVNRFGYVLDWFVARNPDTNDLSFGQAEESSEAWHNQAKAEANAVLVQRARREGRYFDCPDGVATERGEVLYTFPNGYTIQKLTTWKQFQEEGNLDNARTDYRNGEQIIKQAGKGGGCLHHCIGESDNYFRATSEGRTETHSLRTPDNKPQISITISMPDRRITQAKGLYNRYPASEGSGRERTQARRAGYGDDVERFLDDEALMLTEYVERFRLDPQTDFSYVRNRVADIKRREQEAEQRRLRGGGNRRPRMPGRWR